MSIFKKILAARDAINYGEQLSNSATWKKATIATNAIGGLLAAVLTFVPELSQIDEQTVSQIASGVYACYALFNMYSTAATSATVGVRTKSNNALK